MMHEKTTHAAKGKWRGILLELGLPESCLRDKHGPCPVCGGENRFRWDNKGGTGTYICNACGAGDGMALALAFTGRSFADLAKVIDGMLGNTKPDAHQPREEMTEEKRRTLLRAAYADSQPIMPGDLADTYLQSRGIGEIVYPKALRFCPMMRDGDGGLRPAIVAMVGVYGAPRMASMHRTFLRADGIAKAEMASPRKMMPGDVPDGACVALCDYAGGALGIAEGIETAMSASALYSMPVWAALNAAMMAKWVPPDGCEEVAVFGDNDAKFGGQAAAYRLANRLAVKGVAVSVHIPMLAGEDWNDVLIRKRP